MPDVDGVELLRHVRGDDSLNTMPVVSARPCRAPVARALSVRAAARGASPAGHGAAARAEAAPARGAVMSANEHKTTVVECIRGGAEDYLLKPVTRKEVQHIWQHVWRRQQNPQRVPHLGADEVRGAHAWAASARAGC